ncbi:hypothetical protein RND81_04G182800 [Saponaria officinalis]|uniref:Dirigent protein n=1 Tax=Saponaria officinalis TaxID=3572 RepID=A0AAW1LF35_SAPOF
MSKSSLFYLTLILLYLLPTLTISTPHRRHHHHDGPKSMHLTLYQHDTINKTDFIIVPGVIGASLTNLTAPFGTIVVVKDNLTTTPNPSSKVVGNIEGLGITSSFDGLDELSVGRITLELENGLKGSVSVVGVINALEPSDYPVVGGTKDFLFVQGYVSLSPVSFKAEGASAVYRHDYHLFWPSYATKALSMLATNGSSKHE